MKELETIPVLNNYCGVGGNRKLWTNVKVTAVEIDPTIAEIYQEHFPEDTVIVGDSHQYLLEHYKEFNEGFIWGSPPCQSHSKIRNEAGVGRGQNEAIYPDMKLYEEIILLRHLSKLKSNGFTGMYCIENVIGYYKPLIQPKEIGLHYFWSNFPINKFDLKTRNHWNMKEQRKSKFDINNKTALRNCTEPELGLHILNCARNIITKQNEKQGDLFID